MARESVPLPGVGLIDVCGACGLQVKQNETECPDCGARL